MRNRIQQLLKEGLTELHSHNNRTQYYHGSIYPKLQWSAADEELGWATEGYGLYITPSRDQAMGYAFKNNTDGFLHTLSLNDLNMLNFTDDSVPSNIISMVKGIPDFFNLFYYEPTFEDFDINDLEYDTGKVIWSWDFISDPLPKWAIEDNGRAGWFLMKFIDGKPSGETSYGLDEEKILSILKSNITNVFKSELDFDEMYKQSDGDGMHNVTIKYDEIFNRVDTLYWYLTLKYQSLKKATLFFRKAGIDAFMVTSWGNRNYEHFINLINPSKIIDINTQKVKYDKKYVNLN